MKNTIIALCLLIPFFAISQSVGIGTQDPDKSAILDISSKSMGLLVPRMSDVERNAITSPARGLVVYDITDSSFYLYNGKWTRLTPADEVWSVKGNTGIEPAHFIGTSDTGPIRFKVNNVLRMQLDSVGRLELFDDPKHNLFIGAKTGLVNTTGYDNFFLGYSAGQSNSTGYRNQFIGMWAGRDNTTGERNYFSGLQAGILNTTGSRNHFDGFAAGLSNTTGSGNYFSGFFAGYSNQANNNHFTGYEAGYSNTLGVENTFNGFQAGRNNTAGAQNYFAGFAAGKNNINAHQTSL